MTVHLIALVRDGSLLFTAVAGARGAYQQQPPVWCSVSVFVVWWRRRNVTVFAGFGWPTTISVIAHTGSGMVWASGDACGWRTA